MHLLSVTQPYSEKDLLSHSSDKPRINSIYLPTLTHNAWVSRLQTKDIDLTHRGQFLTPDSNPDELFLKNLISFQICYIISSLFIAIPKAFKSLQSVPNHQCSKVVGISSDIFGNVRKIVGNLRKWLGRFRKSWSWRDKNLTHLTQKKLGGIIVSLQ